MTPPEAQQSRPGPLAPSARGGLSLDLIPIGAALSQGGAYLQANGAFLKLFGYEQEAELLGRPLLEDIVPGQRDRIRGINQARERTGSGPLEYETLGLRRDGSSFPMLVLVTRIPLAEGTGTLACITDISTRKEAEARLRKSEERFRAYVEQSIDVLFTLDAQGTFTFVSPAWEWHFGIPTSEVLGKPLAPYVHPEDVERCLGYLRRILTSGQPETSPMYRIQHADGSWRRFVTNGSVMAVPGGGSQFLGVAREVTQEHEAQEALREAHRFNEQIIQGAMEGIIVYGPDLRYRVWNPFMENLSGLPANLVLGRHPLELFPFLQGSGVLDRLHRVLAGEAVEPVDFPFLVPATGRSGWTTDNSAPIVNAAGEIIGVIGTVSDITDRKKAEQALLRERQNAERYLSVAQVILVAFDTKARITLLNPKGYEVLGYEEGELVGKDWFQVCLPPEEYAPVRGVFQRVMAGDLASVDYFENHILRKDGERRLIAWNNAIIKDEEGQIIGTLSSGEDVTERRRAVDRLAEANVLLEQSQILTKMGAWALDVTNDRLTWTPETYRLHELAPKDYTPTIGSALAFYEPESRLLITQAVGRALETGERYNLELKLRTAKGNVLWIRTIGTAVFEEGHCVRLLGTIQNITERKEAEAALREREEQIRVIFEASDAGIILVSPRGEITFANQRMAEMFGIPLVKLIGTTYPDHLHESEKVTGDQRMRMIITGEIDSVSVERKFIRADGATFWGNLSGRRLENPDGSLRALVGMITDVTKRREAEEQQRFLQSQLHQAQKMESLGALAGGVAHDMNNVLGAILGLASAHIENQPPGSPAQKAFGTIMKAAERGGNMLKSLLSFARQNSAEDQDLDLNTILREEVRLLERTTLSKVRLVMDLDPGLRLIRADPGALTHAFMNLCVNAVDAMGDNGMLTLRTRNLGPERVEVQVLDTGTGMAPEVLAKAMDPFFTTKEVGKGTGLGLSIVYSTVKAYQGEMELRSEPGQGTCVVLRFPAIQGAAQPAEPSGAYQTMPRLGGLNVLLVDDDDLIRGSIQGMLEHLGHRTTTAGSGEDALALLESGLEPQVIILDMNMPGLGGAGTLPRLRALRPQIPVLLATGRADQAAQNLVQAHPFVTLLSKPFGMKELQANLAPYAHG